MLPIGDKVLSLVIQIILVVVGVLVFAWFDPFGILAPTVLKLKDTPVSVKSIKDIGELITAEYYGEVVKTLAEAQREDADQEKTSFNDLAQEIHRDFTSAMEGLGSTEFEKKRYTKRKNLFAYFREQNPDIVQHELWEKYAWYVYNSLGERELRFTGKKFEKKELGSLNQERLIKKLYESIQDAKKDKGKKLFAKITKANFLNGFTEAKYSLVDKELKKQAKKNRLVLLGRGWVKAGFDFGTFTENNFKYDPDRRRIHLIGMQPEILSATINPWFIPEEKVPGFEFLIAKGKVKRSVSDVIKVKSLCLNQLIADAHEREILDLAQENARQNLKELFSILINDPEGDIEDVLFHNNMLDFTLRMIHDDKAINDAEFVSIDSTLARMLRENYIKGQEGMNDSLLAIKKSEKMHDLVEKCQAFMGEIKRKNYRSYITLSVKPDALMKPGERAFLEIDPMTRFTGLVYTIVQDRRLDLQEQKMLKKVRESLGKQPELLPIDSVWNYFSAYDISKPEEINQEQFKENPSPLQNKETKTKEFNSALDIIGETLLTMETYDVTGDSIIVHRVEEKQPPLVIPAFQELNDSLKLK